MNALKTVAHQIEEHGTWLRTEEYKTATADIYRIDTVTNATIYTNKRGHVAQVTFSYAMR